jgi:RNA polymerase sigma factor (sigma-70 family)
MRRKQAATDRPGAHPGDERLADQPDRALLAAARTDPDAFAELYRRLVDRVISFAARRVSDPGDVADIVAATFLTALESAGGYDPRRGEPVGWLLGIAARLVANQRRRSARESFALARLDARSLLDADDIERLEARIDAAAQAGQARRAVAGLPAGQREALLLISEDGLTPAEAAQVLGVSGATFRVRLARARRAVRAAMEDTAAPPASDSPMIREHTT